MQRQHVCTLNDTRRTVAAEVTSQTVSILASYQSYRTAFHDRRICHLHHNASTLERGKEYVWILHSPVLATNVWTEQAMLHSRAVATRMYHN